MPNYRGNSTLVMLSLLCVGLPVWDQMPVLLQQLRQCPPGWSNLGKSMRGLQSWAMSELRSDQQNLDPATGQALGMLPCSIRSSSVDCFSALVASSVLNVLANEVD
eukprot:4894764-Amphidinium_carterae.1